MDSLVKQVEKSIYLIKERLPRDEDIGKILIDSDEEVEILRDEVRTLKSHLYDFYARISWDIPWEIPWDNYILVPQIPKRSILANIHVLNETIIIDEKSSLDIYESLITEEVEQGILRFLPLLGTKGRNLGAGVVSENHGFGYHFHYCKGKEIGNHQRTSLQFTNKVQDCSNLIYTLYSGQHGSGIKCLPCNISDKIRASLISENRKLVNKYKDNWVGVSKDFSKF